MCVAFVIPVLCLLYIVLCSSLSCHFHVFSQNVVMPEIFPSQLSVPVIIPHSTCSDCHSVFSSHVGSSCLLLHSGVLWQQVILFHIGKTPCECINLYTRFSSIVQRWRNGILKFFGIDFSLACVDLCWNCKCFLFKLVDTWVVQMVNIRQGAARGKERLRSIWDSEVWK